MTLHRTTPRRWSAQWAGIGAKLVVALLVARGVDSFGAATFAPNHHNRLLVPLVPPLSNGMPTSTTRPTTGRHSCHRRFLARLHMMSDGDGGAGASTDGTAAAPKRRQQRKKRKTVVADDATNQGVLEKAVESIGTVVPGEDPQQQPQSIPLQTRPRAVVTMPVQDVRDLVAGRAPLSSSPASAAAPSLSKSTAVARTTSSAASGTTAPSSVARASSLGDDDNDDETDALQRLLRDARQMRDREGLSGDNSNDDEGFSIPKTAQSALSTLLTVDFFVVCAFLVWFLAGVFASYILHDDTIQIAFNNLFTPVVQPALGLLMIGSLASAVFKEDDDNEQN